MAVVAAASAAAPTAMAAATTTQAAAIPATQAVEAAATTVEVVAAMTAEVVVAVAETAEVDDTYHTPSYKLRNTRLKLQLINRYFKKVKNNTKIFYTCILSIYLFIFRF